MANSLMIIPSPDWLDRLIGPKGGLYGASIDGTITGLMPAVVVTGGSAGIGLAIAREFHLRGRIVVLVARDAAKLHAAELSFAGNPQSPSSRVQGIALDVTSLSAPVDLQAALNARGLYADILVNNAGTGLAGPFDGHSEDALSALIGLNVTALTRLTRHFLPGMKLRRSGGIMNVASLGGYVPGPNQAAYYASKAYVCSLTEALAAELAFSGVRITVVAPGPVQTGFHAAMGADQSLYRWLLPALSPEQTARAAVSGYLWGRTVVVPGLVNKLMAVAVAVLPHGLTSPFVKLLLVRRS